MAQLLPMSEEMIASRGRPAWMARQAMRGLIQPGFAARARAFQVVPSMRFEMDSDADPLSDSGTHRTGDDIEAFADAPVGGQGPEEIAVHVVD